MKLQIDRQHIEAMLAAFPRLEFVREQLCFGNRVELGFNQLEDAELDLLQSLYAAGCFRPASPASRWLTS